MKVWTEAEALSHDAVQQLMATRDAEQFRQALTEALPHGPEGDGWADKDMWTVGELQQRMLSGQLAWLPEEASPGFAECGDYATHVFAIHLQDFVRAQP